MKLMLTLDKTWALYQMTKIRRIKPVLKKMASGCKNTCIPIDSGDIEVVCI